MGGGERVEIFGCIRGWAYCDIAWRGLRGWARGASLQLFYGDRRVSLYQYAPVIGLPFLSFSIGSYWGSYYANQPWYSQAYRWGGPQFDNGPPWVGRGPGPNIIYGGKPHNDDYRRGNRGDAGGCGPGNEKVGSSCVTNPNH